MMMPATRFVTFIMGLAGSAVLICAPLAAEERKQPRPEIFQKLIDCRAIADNAARLACYDGQVALLADAESRNEVLVVDKSQVKKARKGLFGLTLPDLGLFGGKDDESKEEEGVSFIEARITAARQDPLKRWIITLDDGARWPQTESQSILDPKVGDPVRIRKAALGSYMANIKGRTAIRMKRLN